jgi:hypothetical protein
VVLELGVVVGDGDTVPVVVDVVVLDEGPLVERLLVVDVERAVSD